jgi:putative DNA primase/helicase
MHKNEPGVNPAINLAPRYLKAVTVADVFNHTPPPRGPDRQVYDAMLYAAGATLAGLIVRGTPPIEGMMVAYSAATWASHWVGHDRKSESDAHAHELQKWEEMYSKQPAGGWRGGWHHLVTLAAAVGNDRVQKFLTMDDDGKSADPAAEYEPDRHQPPTYSEDRLALTFAEKHQEHLRYVDAWGHWLRWNGAAWSKDSTLKVWDNARAICRESAAGCNAPHTSDKLASAKVVAAVERLARADRRMAATHTQWDSDPWLLCTAKGVVDLRTGRLRDALPTDYQTKATAIAPGGECPLWLTFLDKITASDRDLRDYLQRVTGYSLTGVTREHALFFGHGTGANGKGTFLNTLTGLMGDYATVATMDTFTASGGERHSTELAMLRGARLVTAQETEGGRHWAESRIKALTGGDPITARFMRQDFFTFTPQFKLFIAGNHKPGLRSVDDAIRRRFNLIPFTVTIPPDERDQQLSEKLKAEWPGILEWMIEGCLQWQRVGLAPPAAVTAATDEYLQAEDSSGTWLDECCDIGREHWTTVGELYSSYRSWMEQNGERVPSQKRFSESLSGRFEPRRTNTARGFTGLRLKPPQGLPPDSARGVKLHDLLD